MTGTAQPAVSSTTTMKAPHAFSPSTGAPLSDDQHYPTPLNAPTRASIDGTGELTNGERKSSRVALQQYFERCYRRAHAGRNPPDDVVRAAGTALYQLKREDPLDVWAWYALAERLARTGYWSTWLLSFVDLQCPRCGSRVQIEPSVTGYEHIRCASRCGADSSSERSLEIADRILDLYASAFDPIDRLTVC